MAYQKDPDRFWKTTVKSMESRGIDAFFVSEDGIMKEIAAAVGIKISTRPRGDATYANLIADIRKNPGPLEIVKVIGPSGQLVGLIRYRAK